MLLTTKQIDVLMEPLSTFFQRLSANQADSSDIPQLRYSLKLYLQVCRTGGTAEHVMNAVDTVCSIRNKVIKLIETDMRADTMTLCEVHNLIAAVRSLYARTPIAQVELSILKVLGDLADKQID